MNFKKMAKRNFFIASFIILTTASVLSFILPPETRSIIPIPEFSIPVINTTCAILAFITIFRMDWIHLQYSILLIQTITTTLTGYETLGAFLFTALLIKMFCDGELKKHMMGKIVFISVLWAISILGLYPFGLARVILTYVALLFFAAFYYYVYIELKTILKPLLPASTVNTATILPEPGETISLSEYGLTERQINFIWDYLMEGVTYKDLVEKYYVSLSTVKAEMARAFKTFGVNNKEDFRVLMLQYKLEK